MPPRRKVASVLQDARIDVARRRRVSGVSDKPQTDGFGPLLTLGYVDGDTLPFRQAHDAGTLQRRGVHEDIPSALIRSDRAEALIGVVPFHRAQLFDGGAVARRICRSFRSRTSRRLLRRGGGIQRPIVALAEASGIG